MGRLPHTVGWFFALAAVAPQAQAVRLMSECTPIRMSPVAQADISVTPAPRDEIRVAPAARDVMRVPPTAQPPLRVPPPEDQEVSAELNRLLVLATSVAPSDRGAQPAARQVAAEAAWTLGLVQLHGAGVAQNPTAARQWFRTAQALGHPRAAGGLAWCDIDGCGAPANPQAARTWLAQLRKTQPERAAYLEWLLARRTAPLDTPPGSTADTPGDRQRELLLRAARAGDAQARNELGLEAAFEMQTDKAMAYFKEAAPQSPAAQANLRLLEEWRSLPDASASSKARAAEALTQAQRLHRGDGVVANYPEAIRLYREADSLGSEEAGRMLSLILSQPTAGGTVNVEWMRQLAWLDLSSSVPRTGSPATGSVLQRDATPLYDWLPPVWRARMLKVRPH